MILLTLAAKSNLAMLRFFDADGNLVLMGDESETQRAERLAAKLRELGINPDEI
ncbi:MAG TPA: hypothetical protein VK211_24975 [Kamptonema sp.]|nr:hypothetical protein [Kamptonema sp.]